LTLDRFPQILMERLLMSRGLTIVHNDAHSGNFLLPTDLHRERIYIVDWEQWSLGIGPFDTAYLIALFWYPERRDRFEAELVRFYHNRLQAYGVSGYEWEICWNDYRLGAINNLLVPLWAWASLGLDFGWHRWHQLEKAMLAFEDLNCERLLVT
jgi:thiamine kinase-like enzyme